MLLSSKRQAGLILFASVAAAAMMIACNGDTVAGPPKPLYVPGPMATGLADSTVAVAAADDMSLLISLLDSTDALIRTDTLRDTLVYYQAPLRLSYQSIADTGHKIWGVIIRDSVWASSSAAMTLDAGDYILADAGKSLTLGSDSSSLMSVYNSFLSSPSPETWSGIEAAESTLGH